MEENHTKNDNGFLSENLKETAMEGNTIHRYPRYQPLSFVIIVLIGIFILYQGVGGGLTLLIFGSSIKPGSVNGIRWATLLGEAIFLLVPTLLLMKWQHGKISAAIPWRVPKISEVVLVLVGIFSLNEFLEGYLYFQDKIPLPEYLRPYIDEIRKAVEETYRLLLEAHSVPEMIFVVIVIALTPAICEELLFRGLIQKNLSISFSKKTGFILTGIIFGLYHVNPFELVPLIAIGIYLGFLLYKSETILIPMIAHFFNNAISVAGEFARAGSSSGKALAFVSEFPDTSTTMVLYAMFGSGIFFAISFFAYRTVTSRLNEGSSTGGLSPTIIMKDEKQ